MGWRACPSLESPDHLASRKQKSTNDFLRWNWHVGERQQNNVTQRIDQHKEATIDLGRYALPLTNSASVCEYLGVEEPLEQTAACSRCSSQHVFQRGAQAMAHVGSNSLLHLARYGAII